MSSEKTLSIDVISDVMCPWCFVGQKNLKQALAQVEDVDVSIHWRPYQLDPTLPPEGKDRQTYLEEKFGSRDRAQALHDRIKEAGRAADIDFKFERIATSPNTIDAHRVIRWAASAGEGIQDRLVERLFEMYFLEGENIGEHPVLIKAARESGMDSAVVETLLPTEADREEVSREVATAQQMGVTGVPCFLLEGKYALMGAQPPEALADAIRKVAEAKATGALDQPQA
ncbi:DsbA family oxidoreductase [Nitratireductor basaltis]|uniref:DSBA oxidoreductase n=1 Tax=Nitratireductor basaltis TaxID=472175 RepID=A0A084UAN9_9HYPH|nr:DsbA family oxidoreductase [Nitratireductor basaltis]KFB10025.1 DSBA oxidoreductase [Nitratireductor basaltis]